MSHDTERETRGGTPADTEPRVRMLSRTAGYALNAALALAKRGPNGDAVSASELSEDLGIPYNYLSKILRTLAREGVLNSERGRTGGFRLARPAAGIHLLEVVAAFDDLGRERQCLLGSGTCVEMGGCPAHEAWREASAPAFRFFETRTLADLLPPNRASVDGAAAD